MFRKNKQRDAAEQMRMMIVGLGFVQTASWAESADVLRESPELLTEAGDAAMAAIIEQCRSQDDEVLVVIAEQHRQVLRACREHGIPERWPRLRPRPSRRPCRTSPSCALPPRPCSPGHQPICVLSSTSMKSW